MLNYLEIGFDLELYDEQEFLLIYWYNFNFMMKNSRAKRFMDTIHANRLQQHNYLLKFAQAKHVVAATRSGGKKKKQPKAVAKR